MLKDKKIGFIGGLQTEALLAQVLEAQVIPAGNIMVADGDSEALELLAQCAVVVLSMDDRSAGDMLATAGKAFTPGQIVISAIPGMPLETLEAFIADSPVARVVSNIATLQGRGSTAICPGASMQDEHLAVCRELFAAVGSTYVMAESLIGSFKAISGCGPAFAKLFVQALAQGGEGEGLPPEMARKVAAEMMAGSAEMVLKTGQHPEKLKDDVCSPGGGTIVGVHALEHGGFRGTVMDAVASDRRKIDASDSRGNP